MKKTSSPLGAAHMPDMQKRPDTRRIPIAKVGVKDITYPVVVMDKNRTLQHTVAKINMYVDLPHQFKGTHMSRFVEILNKYREQIALDYYNKGCLKTCKRADKAALDNLRVVRDEARSFMDRCIPAGSLRAVIINCPDPWPKLRHRKRRLVNAEFVSYLAAFMLRGADLYFATDFVDYGLDVAGMMPDVAGFENVLVPDLFRHYLEGYPLSKYMLKFMAEGKQIYYVHYRTTLQAGGCHGGS